jgi:hypothetical protein
LGERELCKLEVVGSIPIGSTILRSFGWQANLPRTAEDVLQSPGEGGLAKLSPSQIVPDLFPDSRDGAASTETTVWIDTIDPCSLTL